MYLFGRPVNFDRPYSTFKKVHFYANTCKAPDQFPPRNNSRHGLSPDTLT